MTRLAWVLAFAVAAAACTPTTTGKGDATVKPPPQSDALADRPTLGPAPSYKAPEPEVYKTNSGMTVWLIERHSLPLISFALAIPRGSSEDPPGKEGLAHITASMLDEGAGDRGALEISSAINDLGADLWLSAARDGSRAGLTTLTKHLDKAFAVFADVVARPRFDPKEYERVSELWRNQLRRRNDNPDAVASVVSSAVLYGPDTPYGHPTAGQLEAAEKLSVAEVKAFYSNSWRPDEAVLVVAGDITRAQLDDLLTRHLSDWKAPTTPAAPRPLPPKPLSSRPRLVLVDRADAPQAVVTLVGDGVAASDPRAPLLDLINTALGGSFTSRLNQNLREDHGWSYGAYSSFQETRGVGPFVARSAVFANVTAAAIQQMRGELRKMADKGLRDDELAKVRARDLTNLIETHETLDGLVGRLSSLATLGLGYDYDGKASQARQRASKAELAALAQARLDPSKVSVVVVGPREQLLPQLQSLDLGEPESWTPTGRPE